MSSCEKKLNGYVNLKRTVGYQSTKIGKFACYILACLSSCLITEWLQLPHEGTSSCHRVSVYCTVSCFAGSVFMSMVLTDIVQQGTDYQPVYSHLFSNFWTNNVTNFPKVTQIISPPNCHLRLSIVVLETFKFKKKGLAM